MLPDVVTRYGNWGDRQILICGGPADGRGHQGRTDRQRRAGRTHPARSARRLSTTRDRIRRMPEFEAVTLHGSVVVADRDLRARRRHDRHLAGRRRRRVPRPAPRPATPTSTAGKTMGIPILYPWANRLSANTYDVDGAVVTLTAGTGGVRTDEHGAPMHGVLAAYPGWLVTAPLGQRADGRARLRRQAAAAGVVPVPARVDADGHARRPHAHRRDHGDADDRGVGAAVLRLPPVSADPRRAARRMGAHHADHAAPAGRRPGHPDRRARRTGPAPPKPLGDTAYDDGFDEVPDGSVFAIAGGDRRVEVTFEKGYPAAQLFAPPQRRRRSASSRWRRRPTRCAAATTASPSRASPRRARFSITRSSLAARRRAAAARPPAPCSSAPPRRRDAGWRAAGRPRRPSRAAATAAPRPGWSAR